MLTSLSGLLGFLFVTFNSLMYIELSLGHNDIKIDYIYMSILVSTDIVGVIIGLVISKKRLKNIIFVTYSLAQVSIITLLFLRIYQNNADFNNSLFNSDQTVWIACLSLNLSGIILSFLMSHFLFGFENNQCIAIAFSSALQNVSLSMGIIQLTLDDDDQKIAINVPIIYGIFSNISLCIFGFFMRFFGYIKENDDYPSLIRLSLAQCGVVTTNNNEYNQKLIDNRHQIMINDSTTTKEVTSNSVIQLHIPKATITGYQSTSM